MYLSDLLHQKPLCLLSTEIDFPSFISLAGEAPEFAPSPTPAEFISTLPEMDVEAMAFQVSAVILSDH